MAALLFGAAKQLGQHRVLQLNSSKTLLKQFAIKLKIAYYLVNITISNNYY